MSVLFFSYSHVDEELHDQLETHLVMLKHQGVIDTFHDRRLARGVRHQYVGRLQAGHQPGREPAWIVGRVAHDDPSHEGMITASIQMQGTSRCSVDHLVASSDQQSGFPGMG